MMNVIKVAGDSSKPDKVEMDTTLSIGDKFRMEYDWCNRYQGMNGSIPYWHIDTAEFEVVDIVCNMLINPHEVWVRLRSCDEDFTKRCGSKEFDAPEKQVLERMAA